MQEILNQLESLPAVSPKAVADAVLETAKQFLKHEPGLDGAGFYTGEQWKERGERYGTNALLVVVHDGSDLAGFFNVDYMQHGKQEAMTEALERLGLYAESCTCWYSAIYRS